MQNTQIDLKSKFQRKNKLETSFLEIETGTSYFLKVLQASTKHSKKYSKDIPYFIVLNLETGEEKMLWINGGLKGVFSQIGGIEAAVGNSYEIIHTGLKEMENGQKINTYDVFAIAEN